jgi:hypothetical protein
MQITNHDNSNLINLLFRWQLLIANNLVYAIIIGKKHVYW